MSSSSYEETQIDNLVKGIKSILSRRKYKVTSEERFAEYIDMLCESEKDPSKKIFARISLEDKVGVAVLRQYVKKLTEEYEGARGLLVASNRFTHYARREAKQNGIWIITSKDPRFDIFTHELVPEHVICPQKEVEELLRKYNLEKRQLPKILVSDPAVKAIGAKPGQVVKILRESPVAGEAIAYRLVIRKPID